LPGVVTSLFLGIVIELSRGPIPRSKFPFSSRDDEVIGMTS